MNPGASFRTSTFSNFFFQILKWQILYILIFLKFTYFIALFLSFILVISNWVGGFYKWPKQNSKVNPGASFRTSTFSNFFFKSKNGRYYTSWFFLNLHILLPFFWDSFWWFPIWLEAFINDLKKIQSES